MLKKHSQKKEEALSFSEVRYSPRGSTKAWRGQVPRFESFTLTNRCCLLSNQKAHEPLGNSMPLKIIFRKIVDFRTVRETPSPGNPLQLWTNKNSNVHQLWVCAGKFEKDVVDRWRQIVGGWWTNFTGAADSDQVSDSISPSKCLLCSTNVILCQKTQVSSSKYRLASVGFVHQRL